MGCLTKFRSRLWLSLLILFIAFLALVGGSSDPDEHSDPTATPPSVGALTNPTESPPSETDDRQSGDGTEETVKSSSPSIHDPASAVPDPQPEALIEGLLKVHFIDVGQGDAILVQIPNGEIMLIDAGDNGLGPAVVSYLRDQGVKRVDHLVATHPHADHIGGMPDVIKAFAIGEVYMPRTTHTTQTYERLLQAIAEKGLLITEAKSGVELVKVPDLRVVLVGPVRSNYTNLNDWSAVVRIEYGQVAFLLTGDAESHSEQDMLSSSNVTLQADVLKIGHHGSKTSSTDPFLAAVSPSIAIITVGTNNRYGHPAPETLKKLESAKIDIYRTDEHGTVVVIADRTSITVETAKGDGPSTTTAGP